MKVSVALCTFNGSRYLPDQLRSLAEQRRPPDELIACDDDSTDDTVATLNAFAATAPFPVRVVVNPARLGTAANFSQAFGLCTGDVILPCDQDDVWLPDKLAKFSAASAGHPSTGATCRSGRPVLFPPPLGGREPEVASAGLVFSDAWLADANLARTGRTAWQDLPFTPAMRRAFAAGDGWRVLLRYNVVTGAAMAFRADLRDVILPIPDGWVPDAWVAFLAAAVAGVKLLPEPSIAYRRHDCQQVGLSRRTLSRQLRAAFADRNRTHFDGVATRFERLAERLERHQSRLRDPALVGRVREKAAMARTQAAMRGAPRYRRGTAAVGELLAGHYHRYDHGVRAFLADVVGP